ncbi:MAG: protein kinase [Chloroflexi bacterium]|uniref:bifunctional serine/threonine-protein kinase/ABC transporter substrate-binding protein n=1 Tax=Candidatus Flexifilum breve TaxID=3140694 RepID=UPI003134EABF|nr:protein kinase [Chloroflexota bacterium]
MDGIRFADFEIGEKIGQGGFAEVYRACQHPYMRDVVLKVLRLDLDRDDRAIARFEREAKVIARLEHPHIVPLYHYDVTDDGRAYLVLRYMRGGTLGDLLKSGPLTNLQFERIFKQVASALDYAHSQGVIHRDIKPSNILLDEDGNAYLADFGLARLIEVSIDHSLQAPIIGTPLYASPEQLQDFKLDHRTDLYSLGVVLYHALTGRPPFLPSENGMLALIYHHLHDLPPPPCSINPHLPESMNPVFGQALAKSPDDRQANARQLVSDVLGALGLQRLTQELHRARQRRRRPVALLLAVVTGIVGALLAFMLVANQPVQPAVAALRATPGLLMGEVGDSRAAQPTSGEIAQAQARSGFIAYLACASDSGGYLEVINTEMLARAREYGLPIRLYNSDRDPILYNAQVEAAWSEGAQAFIVCHLSSATQAQATLEEAFQAGIPVVYLSSSTFEHSVQIEPVSVDTGQALGEIGAEIANQEFAGRARVALLYYGSTPTALAIRAAMQAALLEAAPNVEIVADYSIVWENELPAIVEALQTVEFDLVLVLNQRLAAPLADQLAAAGYAPDETAIVGLIADERTRGYLDDDFFVHGGAQIDIPMIGQAAVDAVVKLMGGGVVPQTIRLPALRLPESDLD